MCITTYRMFERHNKIWSPKDYVVLAFLMGNDFLPKHYSLNLRQNRIKYCFG